jgi:hypothetical protein
VNSIRLRRLAPFLLAASVALAQDADFLRVTHPEPIPPVLAKALDGLDAQRLTKHLAFLTHPDQEGRGLNSRGLDHTVHYLEDQLKSAHIAPLGASYRQGLQLREVRPGKSSLHLHLGARTLRFQAGRDAVLPPIQPGSLTSSWVFAGYGIQEPGLGHDDFKHLDVRGKIVVFREGRPSGEPWQKPEVITKYASERIADRYDSRLALLEKLGAKAAIVLEDGLARRIAEGKEPALPYFLGARQHPLAGEPPLIRLALTPELLERLKTTFDGTATLSIRGQVRPFQGFNVLGKLEGADTSLRQEAILIGAHMDHLGKPGGILHPGADDNASGVSALLEMARALADSPNRPRRTILFAFWTGEEDGKFGSGHYTRHPRWPLTTTKAYLNLDMIGHPWTSAELRTLASDSGLKDSKGFLEGLDPAHFTEPGLSSAHRDLGPILIQAGRNTGMSLHLDWTDGRNGGSDYRDFARLGLPFVRFFGDYFPAYHEPGDTLANLDPAQVLRMTRLALATTWLLADH